MRRIALTILAFLTPLPLFAQVLPVDQVTLNETGTVSVGIQGDANSYYILTRTQDLTDFSQWLHIRPGVDGPLELSDVSDGLIADRAFYQVLQFDNSDPGDIDADGIDDLTELNSGGDFDPFNPLDGQEDFDSDGSINSKEIEDGTDPFVSDIPAIVQATTVSPAPGEQHVSPTRLVRIEFDGEINPATATALNVGLAINLSPVFGSSVNVSPTGRFLTIEPPIGFNPETTYQVFILEDTLQDQNGTLVDLDLDGVPGGALAYEFDTLSLTRVDDTNVFGFVKDSYTGDPIAGATIRVDAFPEADALTDENGRFELVDMPAPQFFVHIDGTTATNAPEGQFYPVVGKPFQSVAGETIQVSENGVTFDIFLPPMDADDVVPLSDSEATDVGFGDAGIAALAELYPDVEASTWDLLKVSFPPGSAVDRSGNPATQAAIIPVPPDRTPSPVPGGMEPPLVISIQATGATQFDVPAPITFPNLEGLAPGESTFLGSFDHDAGAWRTIGTGTVSEDGSVIVSDPGTGIVAPGWHVVFCTVTAVNAILPDDEYGNGIFWGVPDLNGTPRMFDFGTSFSPLENGYMRITPQHQYNQEMGYGWAGGLVGGVNRGRLTDTDSMYDFNETRDAWFNVDVPDVGLYDIELDLGDSWGRRAHMEIFIEDILMGQVSSEGDMNNVTTRINTLVKDGQINFRFRSMGDDRVALNAMRINFVQQGYSPGVAEPLLGTYYRMRENLTAGTGEVTRDILSLETLIVLFSDFQPPHTRFSQYVYHRDTMKVGYREWITPGKSTLMDTPVYSFGYPPDIDTDGDGLYDLPERIIGLDPTKADTDGDGTSDFFQIYPELLF